ncbi:MAG: pyridoxamine 5'-phosphate oxidase family protein [Synergistaceae bacterium]|jgi:nitroimidazol reductase NimA-like FMN-containing flavoprotein (pyridoxamine 5'-phosphate oxidase superfamily)|nr:pyridoxamine 5'-phosphate oxidase family protein [Synergistaceae bacterium]
MLDIPETRRKDKLVTDRGWIEEVLSEGRVVCLALASLDGDPYVLPIGYGYDDGVIYLHGAAKGLKNDLMAANPRVSFNVSVGVELMRDDAGEKFSNKYRSVTGFGTIEEITDLDGKNRALAILMRQYKGPHTDITEERSKSVWVARIAIREMTGKISGYPKP